MYFFHYNQGKPWIAEEGLYILEALAASGLRSIRYFNEIPNIRRIIINDIADAAVESMKRQLAYNNITSSRVVPNRRTIHYSHSLQRCNHDHVSEPFSFLSLF